MVAGDIESGRRLVRLPERATSRRPLVACIKFLRHCFQEALECEV